MKNLILKRVRVAFLLLSSTALMLLLQTGATHAEAPPFQHESQQIRTITGKVSSRVDNEPLPGVNVIEKGTINGFVTDRDGKYQISVGENAILVFSSVGYNTEEVLVGNRSVIDVSLSEDVKRLDELIVTGYRVQSRRDITGSVSSVNSADFQNVPADNLSNALVGRLSGVTITQSSGTPGMASNIKIRAIGTFNNVEPLFVIDGIVRDKYAFDALGANEVESVTILKDGASAAIYGSRAANGVVLVTTKRGSNQQAVISYNGTIGIQTANRIPEGLNAYEHATLINDGLAYQHFYNQNFVVPESDARLYAQDELDYFKTHSWNWVKELWRDPITTQHSLNVNGGTENVRYFMGGTYQYATGSFDNLDYRKLNLRANLDVDVTKNLTASLDIGTDNRMTNGPSWDVGGDGDRWHQEDLYKALVLRSSMVPPLIDGKPVGNWVEWSPAAIIDKSIGGYNTLEWNGINATVALDYKIPFIEGLGINVKYNHYQRNRFRKQFNLPYNMTLFNTEGSHNHIVGSEPVGIRPRAATEFLLNRNDQDKSYQFNIQLNYKKSFGNHNLDAFFVYEQNESSLRYFIGQRNNFVSPIVDQFIGGGGSVQDQFANGRETEDGRLGYVGAFNYDFKQKYLFQAAFRYDGSVIFAPGKRWGFFPSGSLGWRVSNESFFKTKFINDLMLRGSYGLVGNDRVAIYQWLQTFSLVEAAAFDGVTIGIEPGVLANKDITWEKTESYNLGFDTRFWDNRINLKADVFYRHTYDILSARVLSVPTTFGASMPSENYSEVKAKGFEIELGYNSAFGGNSNLISYRVSGNFGYSTNEVTIVDVGQNVRDFESKLGRPVGLADDYSYSLTRSGLLFGLVATDIIRTQEDLDALPEGYTIMGVAPQLGMLNYKDVRGPNSDEPDGRITNDDREYLEKYSIPPMSFGLSLGISWKALSIDALFQGVAGHHTMLHANARRVQGRAEESTYRFWKDHWTINNPDAAYPAIRNYGWPPTDYPASSWFVRDASFLRFKNLNVSYNLPNGIMNMKNVKIFYAGTNLGLFFDKLGDWGYDPELNNIRAYPMMSTHSLGVNLSL